MKRLILVQIGDVRNVVIVLQVIKEAIEANLPLRCSFGERISLPFKAWDELRGQYKAEGFLRVREMKEKEGAELALAITDVDIYSSRLNFVFGSASVTDGFAVLSLYRLHPEFYGERDEGLFLRRVRKEAVHEVGHLFGLGHCSNPECVMSFSNSILDVDRKGERLCERCKEIIRKVR